MIFDLSKLFDNEGESAGIACALDLGNVVRWGRKLFDGPVKVTGRAENRAGIVSVSYAADFVLDVVCDRCLTSLARPWRMEFSHIMVLYLNREDNDEFIVVPDGRLDLAELASSDILLELPTSILCDEGCKGLCPVCGKNLNNGDCGCERKPRDPRLDKLRELLQE